MEKLKKKNRKIGWLKRNKKIIILASVILIALIGSLMIAGGKKNNDNTEEKNSMNIDLYSEDTKAFKIETSYCNLYYPEEWKALIHTQIVSENDSEAVQFWAEFEGKEKIHLFDIIFGGDAYTVGTLKMKTGEIISVNVLSHDIELDDTWTEAEKEKVYIMMEDINYILYKLESVDGYQVNY